MRPDQTAAWRSHFVLARSSLDRRELPRHASRGRLRRLARGIYIAEASWAAASARERHLLEMQAQVLCREERIVFSHQSAAVAHGLPLLGEPLRIHALAARANGGRSDVRLQRHCLDIAVPTEVVDGLEVTTPGATAFQLAATVPFPEAVVVADAVMRIDPTGFTELSSAFRGRGSARVARVCGFADALAETAGESVSRSSIHLAGLASPVLQAVFRDSFGILRVDFWWPQFGVIGEFDGLVKYLDPKYRADRGAAGLVIDEKKREDRLRRFPEVSTVVRWGFAIGADPVRLGSLLRSAGVR